MGITLEIAMGCHRGDYYGGSPWRLLWGIMPTRGIKSGRRIHAHKGYQVLKAGSCPQGVSRPEGRFMSTRGIGSWSQRVVGRKGLLVAEGCWSQRVGPFCIIFDLEGCLGGSLGAPWGAFGPRPSKTFKKITFWVNKKKRNWLAHHQILKK